METKTEPMELEAELKKSYGEENGDIEKYTKLAEIADEKYPCRGYGSIIRSIGKEEAQHKKYIKMILEDMHAWNGTEA